VPFIPLVPDEPDVPAVPDVKPGAFVPDVPAVPAVPPVPLVPPVPAVPDVVILPETKLQPIEPSVASYTITLSVVFLNKIDADVNFKLPEINALPVNCPLSVPCNVDRLDTDAETAPNELDIFSNSVRFASISAAVIGLPFMSLLVIAILSLLVRFFYYTSKYKYSRNKE
jgi:hypothetical protein